MLSGADCVIRSVEPVPAFDSDFLKKLKQCPHALAVAQALKPITVAQAEADISS